MSHKIFTKKPLNSHILLYNLIINVLLFKVLLLFAYIKPQIKILNQPIHLEVWVLLRPSLIEVHAYAPTFLGFQQNRRCSHYFVGIPAFCVKTSGFAQICFLHNMGRYRPEILPQDRPSALYESGAAFQRRTNIVNTQTFPLCYFIKELTKLPSTKHISLLNPI
jgi:hypothetical protein